MIISLLLALATPTLHVSGDGGTATLRPTAGRPAVTVNGNYRVTATGARGSDDVTLKIEQRVKGRWMVLQTQSVTPADIGGGFTTTTEDGGTVSILIAD
ncbi:hypothetical protein [Sphingomicrobium arenosum]|uniref:hypothetical protein n=1 Tax=Sphingomicrobium arenosum TaxID=2233861 RepID=UPI00223F50E1|nr:hypothetical protein [Sphingomicrobium arenosum]